VSSQLLQCPSLSGRALQSLWLLFRFLAQTVLRSAIRPGGPSLVRSQSTVVAMPALPHYPSAWLWAIGCNSVKADRQHCSILART
jgi:hypothetical protein